MSNLFYLFTLIGLFHFEIRSSAQEVDIELSRLIEVAERELRDSLDTRLEGGALLPKDNVNELHQQFRSRYVELGTTGNYKEALAISLACERILFVELNENAQAHLYYDIGYLMDKLGDYIPALTYYQHAIDKYTALNDPELVGDLALAYNNIGVIHAHTGFFTQRKAAYLKAKSLWESQTDSNVANLLSLYGNLLKLYGQYGDQSAARELITKVNSNFDHWVATDAFAKTVDVLHSPKPLTFYQIEKHRLNILFTDLTDEKKAGLAHLDTLRSFYDKMNTEQQIQYSDYLLNAISSAAAPFISYDDPNERRLKKGYLDLGMMESIRLKNRYYEMIFHTQLVSFYLLSDNDYTKALAHLDEALNIGQEMDIREFNLLNIYFKKGEVLQRSGRFDEAEQLIYKGFSILMSEPISDLLTVNTEAFQQKNDIYYINALLEVAKIYNNQFRSGNHLQYGQIAHHFYEIAADLFFQYYQKGLYNPWLDMTNNKIAEGLLSTHLGLGLHDHEQVINVLENNASQHLKKEFEAKHQHYSLIPDSLIIKRNLLLSQVGQQEMEDDSIQERLLQIEQTLEDIDASYTNFFQEKFDVESIQQMLSNEQVILQYTVADSEVFLSVISSDKIALIALGKKTEIMEVVENYHEALKNLHANHQILSENLYSKLIPKAELNAHAYNDLIIIPDNKLSFLPFESLIDAETGSLLIMKYRISYSYSLSLWQLQQQPRSFTGRRLLAAFSPLYSTDSLSIAGDVPRDTRNSSHMQDIAGASREAAYIAEVLKGDLYTEARKTDFLENRDRYQIYHFAMHAVVDEAEPGNSALVFQEDERLLYNELYGLSFPADLVVLSACDTGVGKLEKGEGLMSLSRALTYSGVRASVYSLWQVPDGETSEIMMAFYRYLDEGKQKDEALAAAKRDFLQNNPMKTHPYFWAGFVLNGYSGELREKPNGTYLRVVFILIALSGAGYVCYRFRRRKLAPFSS